MAGALCVAAPAFARAQEPVPAPSFLQEYVTVTVGGAVPRINDYEHTWRAGPSLAVSVDVTAGDILFLRAQLGGAYFVLDAEGLVRDVPLFKGYAVSGGALTAFSTLLVVGARAPLGSAEAFVTLGPGFLGYSEGKFYENGERVGDFDVSDSLTLAAALGLSRRAKRWGEWYAEAQLLHSMDSHQQIDLRAGLRVPL